MRSSLSAGLAVLLLCLATAPALAQGDGDTGGGEVAATTISGQPWYALPLRDALRTGLAFPCGQEASKRGPEITCHIKATLTVPSAVAHFLGLDSRVIADGVAGDMVNHFEDADGDDQGRTYFLKLRSSVKSAIKAKRIRALGFLLSGTASAHADAFGGFSPASDKVQCRNSDALKSSCSFNSRKAVILGAPDGELECWLYMPWFVAKKTTWGKMCPKPHYVS